MRCNCEDAKEGCIIEVLRCAHELLLRAEPLQRINRRRFDCKASIGKCERRNLCFIAIPQNLVHEDFASPFWPTTDDILPVLAETGRTYRRPQAVYAKRRLVVVVR